MAAHARALPETRAIGLNALVQCMHIGFDISQTGATKAGCGYFAHAMIRAMLEVAPEHRYSVFPSFGDFFFDGFMPARNPYPGRDVGYGPRHLTRQSARAFWTEPNLEQLLGSPDVIHANNFWCPLQLRSSRLVYTLYDMGFTIDPAWTTEANRLGCFDGVFRASVAADWVVAISRASREHYLSVFPRFPEDRIRIVYPCSRFGDPIELGVRPAVLRDVRAGAFWLNVGTIEPRKNQRRLAAAFAHYLASGGKPMPLVLAGGKGWLMEDFRQHLGSLGIEAKVVLAGYVSDKELIWLYRNCYANLYPSLFEGFGLPVLEGMQFGAPTIASSSSSIPEVAGDAALLVAPEDTEGLARAMLELASNEARRQSLSEAARAQAGRFDWKRSAASLLDLYEEAVAMPKRRAAA